MPTKIIQLDGIWNFAYHPPSGDASPPPSLPDTTDFVANMHVPGAWDDAILELQNTPIGDQLFHNQDYHPIQYPMPEDPPDGSLPFIVGTGFYRQQFFTPNRTAATLCIGAPVMEAWVWLNGRQIWYHDNYSASIKVELNASMLSSDVNELIIAVRNERSHLFGTAIRGYKSRSGGIFGPVSIRLHDKTHITDAAVYSNESLDHVVLCMELAGSLQPGLQLQWQLSDGQYVLRQDCKPVDCTQLRWTFSAEGLCPWSDRNPKLYQVELALQDANGYELDRYSLTLGLRRLTVDGTQLKLNGSPIYLRGITEHAYFPRHCTLPMAQNPYREFILALQAVGFNWLRCHTWIPPEPYLNAADELGMLIQIEAPRGSTLEHWHQIIRSCRKHPCIVIICGGNEDFLDEQHIEHLASVSEICRTLAPDRLFNPQEAMRGVEYLRIADDQSQWGVQRIDEPFPHRPDRLDRLRQFSDVFGQYAWSMLSYASLYGDWREIDKRLTVYRKPCLSHEVGVTGCYLDLGLEHRYEGTRIGTDLYTGLRRYLKNRGLLHRASHYYRSSTALQRLVRKFTFENARLCTRLSGYDHLGGHDQHWHRSGYPCGVLNEFLEPKIGDSQEAIRRYNHSTVLLLDLGHERVYGTDEHLAKDLYLSIYEPDDLSDSRIVCLLRTDEGQILDQDEFILDRCKTGDVHRLGTPKLRMPYVTSPQRLAIEVKLISKSITIDNSWDIWVFPNAESPTLNGQADPTFLERFGSRYPDLTNKTATTNSPLRIVSRVDPDDIEYLQLGGRLVVLGPGPLSTTSTKFAPQVAGRVDGNLATVIEDHPLTRTIPHEGFCDWPFFNMLESGKAYTFEDPRLPFHPIIEMVSSFKRIVKRSLLYELKIGSGKLLACGLNMQPNDLAAMFFMDSLLSYASSELFDPDYTVSIDVLREIACYDHSSSVNVPDDADMGYDRRAQLSERIG